MRSVAIAKHARHLHGKSPRVVVAISPSVSKSTTIQTRRNLHSDMAPPSFSRVSNTVSVKAAEMAQFGSVRRAWRPLLSKLNGAPSFQRLVLQMASYFSTPSEIDFHLPRTFDKTYQKAELLGEGAFGKVHRVVAITHHHPSDNTNSSGSSSSSSSSDLDLAVKVIAKSRIVNLVDYQALQQEGRMMVLLGGTLNVVHFFGAYEDDENVYLVMEHCVGGDAFARLTQPHPNQKLVPEPDEALVAMHMADILHVVWQCHLLRILHGDLKLENFLFADGKETSPLKLTDFGGASFLQDGEMLHEVKGTPLYTAPEVLQQGGQGYSFPSDMWSCGVILYRLLGGKFPFEGSLLDERILLEEIDFESSPWPQVSQEAKDLVKKLLTRDVTTRLTAEQALQHPWILHLSKSSQINTTGTSTAVPTALLDGTMVQRLQLYRSLNSFQQAVFTEIARLLPLDTKEHIVVLFSELSRHGNSQVGITEFASYLDRSGYNLTQGEAKSFLSRLDLDGDGLVSLDEFCAAFLDWSVIQRESATRWTALVTRVFDSLDKDHDELLSVEDLATLAPFAPDSRHQHSFRSNMRRCFQAADLDGNGVLDRPEFHAMLHIQLRAYEHYARRLH